MIHLHEIHSSQARRHLLESFDPQTMCWLVSDHQSKLELQKLILQKQTGIEETTVLRAKELWGLLFRRHFPNLKRISETTLATLSTEFCKTQDLKMSQNADRILTSALGYFAQVITHPLGVEKISEHFIGESWLDWLIRAEEFYQHLQFQRMVPMECVAPLLLHEVQGRYAFERNLVIDLGPHLSLAEAELIQALSQQRDVHLIAPPEIWRKKYSHLLRSYEFLSGSVDKKNRHSIGEKTHNEVQCLRLTSPLAEVKQATAQARAWLQQGVPATQIMILAPKIESYWPLLKEYAKVEGIPLQKRESSLLHSFPNVQRFLAHLRLKLGNLTLADLEVAEYQQDQIRIGYQEFYQKYASLLDAIDLKRHPEIYDSYRSTHSASARLSVNEVIGKVLPLFDTLPWGEDLHSLFKEFLASSPDSMQMHWSSWLSLFEALAGKKEIPTINGDQHGIGAQNYFSGDSLHFSHRIYLGLSESALKDKRVEFCDPKTVYKLISDLGFLVQSPVQTASEYSVDWQLKSCHGNIQLYFSETNFEGDAESPSTYWLEHSKPEQGLAAPQLTRWDQLQSQFVFAEPTATWDFEKPALKRLSPSALESYLQCPFVYAAKYLYRLDDLGLYDIDMDARQQGILFHSLFESLLDGKSVKNFSQNELKELINTKAKESSIFIVDAPVWEIYQQKILQTLERFIEFEREWRRIYPETNTLAQEAEFSFNFENVELRGKIDRIDSNAKGDLVVIDYKSSKSNLVLSKNALAKNQLQLLFYVWAVLQKSVKDLPTNHVVGATYYLFKNFHRDSGFKLTPVETNLLADSGSGKFSQDELETMMEELKLKVQMTIQNIQAGDFHPIPMDQTDCQTCKWRRLCRAPHLQN